MTVMPLISVLMPLALVLLECHIPLCHSSSDIAEYMGDKVTHVVTNSQWDDNFDEVSSTPCDYYSVMYTCKYHVSRRNDI